MILARVKAFAAFWYDFVVGDDWRVAVGVVVALALTYVLAHNTAAPAWWIPPVAVLILLPVSIRRVTRQRSSPRPSA